MNENTQIIEPQDINGDLINIGSHVLYLNTGTAGKVIDIKKEDKVTWVLMDTTDLYYNVAAIVLTDEKAVKRKIDREEGEVDIEAIAREQASEKIVDIGQITGGG